MARPPPASFHQGAQPPGTRHLPRMGHTGQGTAGTGHLPILTWAPASPLWLVPQPRGVIWGGAPREAVLEGAHRGRLGGTAGMEVVAVATRLGPVRKQRVLCSCCAMARWPQGTRARESPTCESPSPCPSRGTGEMPTQPGAWGTKPVPWGCWGHWGLYAEGMCSVARSLSCRVSPSEHLQDKCHHQSITRPRATVRSSPSRWR